MADPHARRHGRKIVERRLPPLQKGIALAIPLELKRGVQIIGMRRSKLIHLHRVVDDQLRGLQWIDLFRVAAKRLHRIAHRGQIDDCGYAGEVLHQHAGGHVGDLARGLSLWLPGRQEPDVVGGYSAAVFVAQQVLEQNSQ